MIVFIIVSITISTIVIVEFSILLSSTIVICIIIVMIITGATAVSKLLMNSNTLQELDVCHNTIGDHGLSVIVEQLHHITTLTKLDVLECGLSVEGIVIVCRLYISPDSEIYLTISLVVRLIN